MNSSQFAWAYLLKNGSVGVKPSYYGGFEPTESQWEVDFGSKRKIESYQNAREYYQKQIKKIGVDWKKTKAPESTFVDEFNGTFNDPTRTEYLVGDIYLKNGEVQHWIAESIDVTNVFDMMAKVDEIKKEYSFIL